MINFQQKGESLANTHTILPTTIPDTQYEQVIADRYLFAPFANESSAWPVLTNVQNVWQVVSLPQYHSQAAEGFWLLIQTMNDTQPKQQMSYMSLSSNTTSVVLPDIDIKIYLVVSHNETIAMNYTAALISLKRIQFILCNQLNATSCSVIKSILFPSVLENISQINAGLFIDHLGVAEWLYIATDIGLHGLDLLTFTITPYINEINVSVSSLAWSSKHQTVFVGTETKLWIYSYGVSDREWRFEHITGLIDAPITSLVYDDVQDKLWIGQQTGITLLSPIIM